MITFYSGFACSCCLSAAAGGAAALFVGVVGVVNPAVAERGVVVAEDCLRVFGFKFNFGFGTGAINTCPLAVVIEAGNGCLVIEDKRGLVVALGDAATALSALSFFCCC